jgi:hypothetical protein
VQRTIPNIEHHFIPLEEAIRDKLIPVLFGRNVSETERRILAMPVRLGGMGITNPTNSSKQFTASAKITENLTQIIFNQEKDFANYDADKVKKNIAAIQLQRKAEQEEEFDEICGLVDARMRRILELEREKGTGAWLTAIPVQSAGYVLNKKHFRGAVCVRYGWNVPGTPSFCQCGEVNDVDHALICKKGGHVIMRHNRVRDLEGELMREVCYNVEIEPDLLPIESDVPRTGNTAERARLDVAGVGVWGAYEKTFLDIRIMHPNAPTYINKPIEQVYEMHESEKKTKIQ